MKTIKFWTLGCKVNQYDTQNIREQFLGAGFSEVEGSCPADIYVVNTCTVTQRADSESLYFIRRGRRENASAKIIVTGCLAELDKRKISSIDRKVLIAGNKEKTKILSLFPQLISPLSHKGRGEKAVREEEVRGISYFKGHNRAFLKIQDGCNNFCSYCKVPLVRGVSRSNPPDEVINEAVNLVKNGFKEIVLCGICLGSYGKDLKPRKDLVYILDKLEKISGLERIRLSSIEAGDVRDKLIDKIARSKKICHHLHIPIQSGSSRILEQMNRQDSRQDYIELINKIKRRIPLIAITTDVIAGFPSETESDFRDTISLIKQVIPLKTHIFPYSSREGTVAAKRFVNILEPVLVKERMNYLVKIAAGCSLKYRKQFLNKQMEVLIEDKADEQTDCWQGYTSNYIRVLVKSSDIAQNMFLPVRINKVLKDYSLAQKIF